MNKRDPLGLSNEAIAHQTDSPLFKELTLAFKALIEGKGSIAEEREASQKCIKSIARHTGLHIDSLEIDDNAGGMIEVVKISNHNPLLQRYEGFGAKDIDKAIGVSAKLKKALATADSEIDYKKGKVSGVFAKIPFRITIGRLNWRWARMTPEEVAGILIHEVGHAFTMLSNVTRTVTANMAVTCAVEALSGIEDRTERLRVIELIKKDTGWDVDAEQLAGTKNRLAYEAVFSREVVKMQFPSATGTTGYELSASEFVADQFAVRHGAGVHVATALDKLDRMFGINRRQTAAAFVATETVKVIGWAVLGAWTLGVAPILMFTVLAVWGGYEDRDYDTPNDRVARMRNDLIQGLKDPKLTRDRRVQFEQSINALDKLLEGGKDRRTLMNMVWQSLHPRRKAAYNARIFQQEIEKVINNDIFAAANSLSILATK